MDALDEHIRRRGRFLRRRDLLRHGYTDDDIRCCLEVGMIFRVRHGWYSTPDAPPDAVRAVRIGGRLTGVSALESYGLRVPRRDRAHILVRVGACRLRKPTDRYRRLELSDPVRVHWTDRRQAHRSIWRVSIDDALLVVLTEEPRDIAVACCSAVMRHKGWRADRMDAVFARAPGQVQGWRELVSALDDSHGETFIRLWLGDAGVPWESQPRVPGVGRLDGRVAPHTYVEVDGGQHDPRWTGAEPSTYEHDHDRDLRMTMLGNRVLRFTYRQLYGQWPDVLAAIIRARADDAALSAYRRRHPYRPPSRPPSPVATAVAVAPAAVALTAVAVAPAAVALTAVAPTAVAPAAVAVAPVAPAPGSAIRPAAIRPSPIQK